MATNKLGTNLPPLQDGKPSLAPNPNPNTPPAAHFGKMKRVRIILEDHPDIPPTGLYISHNGRPYMIQTGVEVDVPEPLIEILNNAITTVPIMDPRTLQVKGSRNKMRFPFRIIMPVTPAEAA